MKTVQPKIIEQNNTKIIEQNNTNLSAGIFWRNSKLSIKDALINSIQLENQNNIDLLMEEYGADVIWNYLPDLVEEFKISPFFPRFIHARNLMAIKKNTMEGKSETAEHLRKIMAKFPSKKQLNSF